jgi:hypothetical protein
LLQVRCGSPIVFSLSDVLNDGQGVLIGHKGTVGERN